VSEQAAIQSSRICHLMLRRLADAPHHMMSRMHGDKLFNMERPMALTFLFFHSSFQCIGTGSRLVAPQVIYA